VSVFTNRASINCYEFVSMLVKASSSICSHREMKWVTVTLPSKIVSFTKSFCVMFIGTTINFTRFHTHKYSIMQSLCQL
jgi:hypothetical protein